MESLAGYDSRESVKDNRNDCFTASPVAEPLPSRDVVANLGASVTFRREEKGTKRGKVMLVDNSGYTYNINKQTDHATYWQCTVRPKVDPCKASVTEKDGTFKAGKSSHNHKAKTEAQKKKFKPAKAVVNEKMSTDIFTPPRGKRRKKENSDPHLSLSTQVKNMQISRNDSSSEDRNDSGFDTYTTPQDTSRNGDPLLSSINITRSPELDEYSPNSNCESTEEVPSSILNEIDSGSVSLVHLMDVESRKEWLKQYDHEVVINPAESRLQGGVPCIFTFKPELKSDVNVKASFGNLEPIILEKTRRGYLGEIPASPKMTPGVIPVLLISTTTGKILAETSLKYCVELYERKNLDGKPGASDSRRREDGGNDGGASGGGASGGRASGGRSSGGRSSGGGSSGEGAGGSGVSGDGTGGTGAGGCGGKGCGTYGGGATGCQYRIEASQLGSDVVSKLCELIQKCSVGIQRQEPSATQNKACIEAEEDLEDDQLSCTQESNENYFADTEDFSSVSSETDSALSDSESWDESLSDSPLSFPWVNSRSSKSQEAILETESTQHSREAVYSKLNVSHEIQELMTEGFTSEDSIGNNNYVGSGVCHKWNTSLPESKKTEENCEKDDHNKMQDLSQEWAFFSEGRTSHIQLASHDDTPVLCLDALDLIVENEESQYQDNELFEAPHAENAKPKDSESVLSVTSNQQSATHAGPTTQSQAPQSPVSNPSWNGDSKLNMAPPQCSDEEIHSGQEWEESGEGLASWFDLCENENAGKNERSRWEMSSIEPNKTDGGVEKDVFDSEEDLSQEQGLFSEQGNSHVHLSLPDDTSVQSRRLEVENEEIQDTPLFEAAGNGQTDVVRLLIENGADVNKEVGFFWSFWSFLSGVEVNEEEGGTKPEKKKVETNDELSKVLDFKKFDISELDCIFADFKTTLDPFVQNREDMAKAEESFKKAVTTLEQISPHAQFSEYVHALKTRLTSEGIVVKIKEGALSIYTEGKKTVQGILDAVAAVNAILKLSKELKAMPMIIAKGSDDAVERAEGMDLQGILKREFKSVWDLRKIPRFKKAFSNNVHQLRRAPDMVRDFYSQAKKIILEIYHAFADEEEQKKIEGELNEGDDTSKEKDKSEGNKAEEANGGSTSKKKTDKKEGSKADKSKSNKEKDKEEFHKKLKFDSVGLDDIDNMFSSLATAINPFVETRESLQAAKESFENVVKKILNFDAKKELKEYIKELKKDAKEGNITIYIDETDGEIKVKSIEGVKPPKPYRDAVEALKNIRTAGSEAVELEPDVQHGIEEFMHRITQINPLRDFHSLLKKKSDVFALPGKIKRFNENRKKAQEIPGIVKEFCLYAERILTDILEALTGEEDSATKKEEGSVEEGDGQK